MKKELKNDNSASKVKAFFVKLGKGIVNIVKTVGRWLYRAFMGPERNQKDESKHLLNRKIIRRQTLIESMVRFCAMLMINRIMIPFVIML